MALRINTNIAALNAHKNMIKTDNSLSSSLEKLSSGLRINKAADDASGMAIADSLRSQALGLGQAIRNGNDGISIVQTADAALEESINIVNTIKQKAIQSAQDGQTTQSRQAIQADISKLREELDTIAKTTAFNNQKLLSGNFTDKKFQIGAYAGETVDISIQSTEATKLGHINTSDLTFAGPGLAELNVYSNLKNETYSMNSIELAYSNNRNNGVGAVADAINKLSDVLGVSATASVEISTNGNIVKGSTDKSFAINGVAIGALAVSENDSNGALVSAINNKTSEHGVTASVDQAGVLTLISTDDRAIDVTMEDGTRKVMAGTEDMSTLGKVEVRQEGTSEIIISDANKKDGIAVSTVGGSITVKTTTIATTQDSIAAVGSKLVTTTLGSGTGIVGSLTIDVGSTASGIQNDVIGAGSVISSGSIIGSGTKIQGSITVSSGAATTGNVSTLAAGSSLASGSTVGNGSIFIGNVSGLISGAAPGAVTVSGTGPDMRTIVNAIGVTVNPGSTLTLASDALLAVGTILAENSVVTEGSIYYEDIRTKGDNITTNDMIIKGGGFMNSGTTLATGSSFSDTYAVTGTVTGGAMTLETGSRIGAESSLTDGSSIGVQTIIKNDVTVDADTDMFLASGSVIFGGSTLTAGTYLTVNVTDEDGVIYKKDTTLDRDIITGAAVTPIGSKGMVLNEGSILKASSTLGPNNAAQAYGAVSAVSEGVSYRLSDVDVTTQQGAQIGIAVADAALKSLDKVRSDLGSVQNQLTSTIANISTTKVNVMAAESTIRDVDFAEESSTFTKMQILSQAGTFAMSQANASAQQVLSLLQ